MTTKKSALGRRYRISPDIAHREIEAQILLIRPGDSFLYTLNASGRFIWLELQRPQTLGSIVKRLAKRYGISEEAAAEDVLAFVEDLEEKRVIVEAGEA